MKGPGGARGAAIAALVAVALIGLLFLLPAPQRGRAVREPGPDAALPSVGTGTVRPVERTAVGEPEPPAGMPAASERAGAAHGRRDELGSALHLRIDGRVVDLDGRPIDGAEVRLSDDALVAVSDAAGIVAAELELGAEAPLLRFGRDVELELQVTAPAQRGVHRRLAVADGATLHLGTLRLGAGGDAIGRVLDEDGAPLADAWVGWRAAVAFPVGDAEVQEARYEGIGYARDSDDAGPGTWTDTEGRFHLRGLPEGEVFLVANDEECLYAWSDVFALRAGDTVERTLVLERDRRYSLVHGRVLDPDGRPVAGAEVKELARNGDLVFAFGTVTTDADGRFEQARATRDGWSAERELVALDPAQRFAPSEPVTVGPGEAVELRLRPPRTLEIRMIDAAGGAVAWGHVRLSGVGFDAARTNELVSLERAGRARVLLPSAPFQVEAMAPGYRRGCTGPYDPASVADPLVLVMTQGDVVHGRVTAGGEPVAGARIGLGRTRDPARVARSTELAPLARPFLALGHAGAGTDDATTGRDGRFEATLHADGWHVVRVVAEGFPETFFGPFEWTRGPGAVEVELALAPAGAIEGRILVPPGSDPSGRLVGASNGWEVAWTAAADAEGRFRIEGLAPGAYQVRACAPPAASRQEFTVHLGDTDGAGAGPALEWDCVVRAGATTHHDVDVRDEEDFVLAGRLVFGDTSAAWSARLLREGEDRLPLAVTGLQPDGMFELRLARGGALVLELRGERSSFRQRLELAPGRTEWSAEVPTASLELRGAPPLAADGAQQWAFVRWTRADGLTWFGPWYRSGHADPFVQTVPAGTLELLGTRGEHVTDEPVPFLALELAPGETRLVDLDQPR